MRGYWLAVAASIVAMLPAGPSFLPGLAIGIWVLSVLAKAEGKAGFPAGRQRIEANGGIRESTIKAAGEGLIAIAGIALLMAVGIGLWLKFAGGGWDSSIEWPPSSRQSSLHFALAAMAVTSAVYALFIGTAGILMRRVRGRLFALLSVVIAGVFIPVVLALNVVMEYNHMGKEWMVLIPLWLGMPICLWAAAVLYRRDVRAMFLGKPDVKTGFPQTQLDMPHLPSGIAPTGHPGPAVNHQVIRRRLRVPAIGLIVTGIISCSSIIFATGVWLLKSRVGGPFVFLPGAMAIIDNM